MEEVSICMLLVILTKSRQLLCSHQTTDPLARLKNAIDSRTWRRSALSLKLLFKFLLIFTKLANHCINNSYFPNKWREAIIRPIPKKPGIITAKDFRPISLTSNLGKLLESIILRQIESELHEGVIPEFQFGFKAGHSKYLCRSVFARLENPRQLEEDTVHRCVLIRHQEGVRLCLA